MNRKYLRVMGAADLTKLSPWTIRRYLTDGRLTRYKIGGVTLVDEVELLGLIRPEAISNSSGITPITKLSANPVIRARAWSLMVDLEENASISPNNSPSYLVENKRGGGPNLHSFSSRNRRPPEYENPRNRKSRILPDYWCNGDFSPTTA